MAEEKEPANRIFIINFGEILWSEIASNHKELHVQRRTPAQTTGGGEWHLDRLSKSLWFFGTSPFGPAKFGEIKDAIIKSKIPLLYPGYKIRFSSKETADEAMIDFTEVIVKKEVSPKPGAFWNK